MSADYEPKHIQRLFNLSPQTVRNYAADFARHLSPRANPGDGKHRAFTQEDVRVFSLIVEMNANKRSSEEIHAALDAGQRGDAPPVAPDDMLELALSPQARELLSTIDDLADRLAALESRQASKESEELEVARLEIRKLERQIGRLEAMLEIERGKNKS